MHHPARLGSFFRRKLAWMRDVSGQSLQKATASPPRRSEGRDNKAGDGYDSPDKNELPYAFKPHICGLNSTVTPEFPMKVITN
jgi:hypothetical protein